MVVYITIDTVLKPAQYTQMGNPNIYKGRKIKKERLTDKYAGICAFGQRKSTEKGGLYGIKILEIGERDIYRDSHCLEAFIIVPAIEVQSTIVGEIN